MLIPVDMLDVCTRREERAAMGFPQDIRSLARLNKLLDELGGDEFLDEIGQKCQRLREQEQRQPQPVRTMAPRVEAMLGNLLYRMYAELMEQHGREPHGSKQLRAILERTDGLRAHAIEVAMCSQSPAQLRMRLIRDGTLPDEPVIEELPHWEWLPRSR
jgi:hypothetical protein